MESDLPKRKPTRLKDFDYGKNGAYFITICTEKRKNMLSVIVGEDPSPTVSTVVGWLKYQITKDINDLRESKCEKIFQRSFYDHVIRNQDDYMEIAKYIKDNPARWYYDKLYNE